MLGKTQNLNLCFKKERVHFLYSLSSRNWRCLWKLWLSSICVFSFYINESKARLLKHSRFPEGWKWHSWVPGFIHTSVQGFLADTMRWIYLCFAELKCSLLTCEWVNWWVKERQVVLSRRWLILKLKQTQKGFAVRGLCPGFWSTSHCSRWLLECLGFVKLGFWSNKVAGNCSF